MRCCCVHACVFMFFWFCDEAGVWRMLSVGGVGTADGTGAKRAFRAEAVHYLNSEKFTLP